VQAGPALTLQAQTHISTSDNASQVTSLYTANTVPRQLEAFNYSMLVINNANISAIF